MGKLNLEDFPLQTFDKIRYGDTDRQGHVNNAVFAAFLETGRVEVLYHPDNSLLSRQTSFVIVSMHLDFLQELSWPGRVETGIGILKIGTSSIMFYQKLSQNGACAAQAKTVVVHVNHVQKKSTPLSDKARQTLSAWLLPQE